MKIQAKVRREFISHYSDDGETIRTEIHWAEPETVEIEISDDILKEIARMMANEFGNAPLDLKYLAVEVGELRSKAESADRAALVEHLKDYRASEIKRLRAAIEAALEGDAKSAYLPPDIEDMLRDALGEA